MKDGVSGGACPDCRGKTAAFRGGRGGISKHEARTGLQRMQAVMGLLLFLSAGAGAFLLATDRSLWLLAVSHAVGLVIIVAIDLVIGVLSFARPRGAYVPSIAAGLLGVVLQLGDIFTAPQYGLSIPYFAGYLFGLWAFDLLLALQLGVMVVGVAGRPYATSLARRKSLKGREMNLSRRQFAKSLLGLAAAIGLGVVVSSIKIPSGASPGQTTHTGGPAGSVANVNDLKVGTPVFFEYPSGYPNMLMKSADGTLVALSMLCTHVCCVCSYDPPTKRIYCPCHGSVFDSDGNVLQGPALTALPQVTLQVDNSGFVTPTGVTNPGPCQA